MTDSLDTMLQGPTQVRERDHYMQQFSRSAEVPKNSSQYHVWHTNQRPGPVKNFRPDASFTPLTSGGKIQVDGQEAKARQQGGKYHIPGYTGYIRHKQHISGRRYSEMTRMAYSTGLVEHVTQENIPSDPQNNRRIPQQDLKDRFMYSVNKGKDYNLPGYTGHVPGIRPVYGQTCGKVTRDGWDRHHENFENNPQERSGYAFSSTQRKPNHISSAPLPGSQMVSMPPTKLIPRQVAYLNYFST